MLAKNVFQCYWLLRKFDHGYLSVHCKRWLKIAGGFLEVFHNLLLIRIFTGKPGTIVTSPIKI